MTLTPYEEVVLLAASAVPDIPYYRCIPHGVFRGLVNRGLLTRHVRRGDLCYELTADGRWAVQTKFGPPMGGANGSEMP